MSTNLDTIRDLAQQEYKWGFITDIEEERIPKGLSEDVIRLISTKKNEPQILEIMLLCGFYRTVSYLANGLQLPLEDKAERFPAQA